MSIRVHVEGRICAAEDAKISVFDRGYLYGDGVYETLGTIGGKPFALDEHLDRLSRSAELIGLSLPTRSEIERALEDTLAAAENAESRIRIVVSRDGGTRLDLDPAAGTGHRLVIIVAPLVTPSEAMRSEGVAVEIVARSRADSSGRGVDPAVKSANYLTSVLALGEARRRRPGVPVHEAILCTPEGDIAEGATSNVFCVIGDQVRTPPLAVGILAGVTRAKVIAVARAAGVPCVETRVTAPELRHADEVFITSSTRGVLPVTRIDGEPVGDGRPGAVARRLRELYEAAVVARAGEASR